jgi:hypothetical protein
MTGPFKLKKGKGLEDFFKSATKTPNPKTKAVEVDHSKTLSTHLDSRGPIQGDYEMENKGDFNISNLHKDTEMSLSKKKKKN